MHGTLPAWAHDTHGSSPISGWAEDVQYSVFGLLRCGFSGPTTLLGPAIDGRKLVSAACNDQSSIRTPKPQLYQSIWWSLAPGPEPYQSIWWPLLRAPNHINLYGGALPRAPNHINLYGGPFPSAPNYINLYGGASAPGPELYQSIFLWFSLNQHETLAGCPLQPSHLQLFPPAVTENMQWRRRYRIILRQQQRRREQPTGFHRPRRGSCLAGFRGLRVSGFRGLAGFSVAGHQAKCLLNSPMPVEQ